MSGWAGLRIAQNKPFVVQERVQPFRLVFPMRGDDGEVSQQELLWDLNPFVWNGDVADGALVRASQRSNLSAGTGSVTPVWIVD